MTWTTFWWSAKMAPSVPRRTEMADTEVLQSSAGTEALRAVEGASVGVPVPGLDGGETSGYALRGTIAEARDLFRTNHEFFILTCYPDLTLRVPQFHCELLEAMTDQHIPYLVCVCPRGFAKTMIVRATAAYALMTGESHSLLSSTATSRTRLTAHGKSGALCRPVFSRTSTDASSP